ncbi:hypothetical protein [Sphaerisporangium perillae]|uniref:hypothetical protein n=1 Tax=Sphaerisporangium perillae TaxID=2935860 RepID=UPI00200FE899|nr:hypothetical protein [Sphaerisporangium perillae]
MSFVPHQLDRQRDSLDLEPEPLGSGGQGVVKRLRGPQQLVYKEYMPQAGTVDGRALAEIVDFGRSLPATDQQTVLRQCAWPVARVVAGNRVTGFLMPEVPRHFSATIGRAVRLVELQYLLYKPGQAWRNLYQPSIQQRLHIAMRATELVELLHKHGIVLGDISYRNLLWQPAEPHGVFLLDCDGFRRQGREPVLRQAHTPDWNDPYQPRTGPDLDTDRYKLALLIGRVLSRNAHVRPGDDLKLLPGLDPNVARQVAEMFALAARPYGQRPIAAEWLQSLNGRRWILLSPRPLQKTSMPAAADRVTSQVPRGSVPVGRSRGASSVPATPLSVVPSTPPPRGEISVRPRGPVTSRPVVVTPPLSIPSQKAPTPGPIEASVGTSVSPPPVLAPTSAGLGERVVTSETYVEQRDLTPNPIPDDTMAALLDALEANGGRLSIAEVAKVIVEQVDRTRLLMSTAKRLLNIDAPLLTLKDGDQTVDLNLRLLKEQFLDEEGQL